MLLDVVDPEPQQKQEYSKWYLAKSDNRTLGKREGISK
jgi:hypothetical protein